MGGTGPLRRLVSDDRGQDLAEYALLSLFVGLVGLATWQLIASVIAGDYAGYDSGVQGLWEPPDP